MASLCTVCFETLIIVEKVVFQLPCGHRLHIECMNKLVQNFSLKCPECRVQHGRNHHMQYGVILSKEGETVEVLNKLHVLERQVKRDEFKCRLMENTIIEQTKEIRSLTACVMVGKCLIGKKEEEIKRLLAELENFHN